MQPHMRRHVKYFKNSPSLKFLFFFHSFLVSVNNLPFFIFSFPLQALTWEITILPAGIEETLWVHPLGPLVSSACLSTSHVTRHTSCLATACWFLPTPMPWWACRLSPTTLILTSLKPRKSWSPTWIWGGGACSTGRWVLPVGSAQARTWG